MRAALITILVASVVVTAQNNPPTENGIQSSTSGYQYPNYPFRQNQFYTNTFNGFGGNLNFVPSGSHSILSSNGNNIVISRRMNADNKPEDYISISNPSIRIDGGYFACGSLICPANTFKCAVTSETLASDRKQMKTTAECFDKSGKKLDSKMYNEINPFPELEPPYSRIATVDRDGAIHTEDSNGQNTFRSNTLTKEQTEALARGISEQTRRIEAQIAEQQRHFQAQMEQLHRNLEQTFSRNFPFGNSFSYGYNFPFGNHFPFANNFPFGYEPYPPYNYRTPFNPNYGQPPTTANVFYPETSDPNDVY